MKNLVKQKLPFVYICAWFLYFTIIQRFFFPFFSIRVRLKKLNLRYWTYSTKTGRGIGKVSTEDLVFLLSQRRNAKLKSPGKNINFFPSIVFAPYFLPRNSVVIIHDVIPLIYPIKYSRATQLLWRFYYKRIAVNASLIFTISETSKNDIVLHLGIPKEKIKVIPCFIENNVADIAMGNLGKDWNFKNKKYITFVGKVEENKNLDIIFQAIRNDSLLDINLVIIGNNLKLESDLPNDLSERVHVLTNIGDSEKNFILSKSLALVYPSFYEGFGLPPFEAALVKCPIICSKIKVLEELWNADEVYFASPLDVNDWIRAIQLLTTQKDLADTKVQKAFIKAKEYGSYKKRFQLLQEIEKFIENDAY